MRLRAGTRHEAANLCVAVAVVVGPHNSRAEPVGVGPRQGLRVPIDILHADTVGKSAAQSVSAGEAVEPLLRAELANRPSSRAYKWFGTTTYIVVTTTSPAVDRT